jgi:BON domain
VATEAGVNRNAAHAMMNHAMPVSRNSHQGPVVLPEGNYRDDAKLATAANNALAQNVTVPDTVEATAEDGNITLTGTVSYGTQRAAAEAAVVSLIGVRTSRTTSISPTLPTRSMLTCTSGRPWTALRWSRTTVT